MVPLNPLLTAHEVAYHLSDSDTKLLITFEQFVEPAFRGAQEAGNVPTYVVNSLGSDVTGPEGTRHFDELCAADDLRDIHPTTGDDTAVLLYTSGTTGTPKGAELTHFQLYMNCTVSGELFGFSPDDIMVGALPLFHIFGLSCVLNIAVRFRCNMALIPRFGAEAVADAIERHRCTVFSGVPTMFVALLHLDTTSRDLSSLRAANSGGASLPGEMIRAFEEKFPGVVLLEGYGLSETASTATFNIDAQRRKVLSVGRPIWGVEVRVVDGDDKDLPPGEEHVGEIVVRGHSVMKGYYKKPEATAEVLHNGWFHTGDLAYRDEDGYLFIVDRLKDLVIRGGYNVYPREIEEVLYAHPAVAEAAVVGRPDERLGEEVVACVTLKPGATAKAEELITYCKEWLAAYKYPREVRILTELPKGPTGKILKRELRG